MVDPDTSKQCQPPRHGVYARIVTAGVVACFATWSVAALTHGSSPATAPATSTSSPASRPDIGSLLELNYDELDDIDLLEMDLPMVVTASRRAEKITSLPYAVSVITAEDIRAAGAWNVADALRLAAGVDVAELSWGITAVSPRGLHGMMPHSVLVLVDGRQIFDAWFGGNFWGDWPLQIENIKRIEVVRGPAGVTWGSNALNGAINIITKDPAEQLGLTVTGGGGSRGAHKEYLGYAFEEDKLRLRVSGEYESSDGFSRGGTILGNLDDDTKSPRMNVHSIYEASPYDTFTLSGGGAAVNGSYPVAPLGRLMDQLNSNSQSAFILGKWEHRIDPDSSITLNGYVNDFWLRPHLPVIDYRYQQLALQLSHTFKPAEDHWFTWGVDTRTDLLDATNAEPFMLSKGFVSTAIIGLYAQDDWRFAPRWRLSLGGRIDYEFYGGFQPSGRVALSYDLSDTSLVYGAVSRAFQMPSAGTRFDHVPFLGGMAYYTADRNIQRETVVAYELGYRGRFFDSLETAATLFCHSYDDLVIMAPRLGPPGLFRFNLENGYDAYSYGAELEAKYALTRDLMLLGTYTFQNLDARGGASVSRTDYLSPPRHKFMVGTRYSPREDLHLSAHLYYTGDTDGLNPVFPLLRRNVSSYFRLDLRAEHEFWKDRASVAVGVRNLLDNHHLEGISLLQDVAEVPRTVYAEIRLTFK